MKPPKEALTRSFLDEFSLWPDATTNDNPGIKGNLTRFLHLVEAVLYSQTLHFMNWDVTMPLSKNKKKFLLLLLLTTLLISTCLTLTHIHHHFEKYVDQTLSPVQIPHNKCMYNCPPTCFVPTPITFTMERHIQYVAQEKHQLQFHELIYTAFVNV